MTEKEIIDRQEQNGQREFYLALTGSTLHAYGYGALAMAEVTGLRVTRQPHQQLGELHMVELSAIHLNSVRVKMFLAGGYMEEIDDRTWLFRLPACHANMIQNSTVW